MNYSTKIVNKDQSILENRMVKDHTDIMQVLLKMGESNINIQRMV
jgi:hypothetical protein